MMAETGRVPDTSEVADRLAIQEVIGMHCRGVDRANADILMSCYWPDAEGDYGGYRGAAHPFCGPLTEAIQAQRLIYRFLNCHVELKFSI